MGAAPAQIEHYRREVSELQELVAEFRREVADLKDLKAMASGGSDDEQPLALDEYTNVPPYAPHRADDPHHYQPPLSAGGTPHSCSLDGAAASSPLGGGALPIGAGCVLGGSCHALCPIGPLGVPYGFPARRVYVELEGALEASWYENRPLPPLTVKLLDDRSPPGLVSELRGVRARVRLCNGRGLPEERTANGVQELLVGEHEVPVENGYATFQGLKVRAVAPAAQLGERRARAERRSRLRAPLAPA